MTIHQFYLRLENWLGMPVASAEGYSIDDDANNISVQPVVDKNGERTGDLAVQLAFVLKRPKDPSDA